VENQNSVAKVLRVIGIVVMIGGFFIALISGSSNGVNWNLTLPALFSSFVTGMVFIGFSEVIALLHKIHLQLPQNGTSLSALSNNEVKQQQPQKDWHPSPQELVDIEELYSGQIVKILPTPFEDYCVVQIEGEDHIDVVELGGFKPRKITADSEPELFNRIQNWFNNLAPS
jgi:hypothetical protein